MYSVPLLSAVAIRALLIPLHLPGTWNSILGHVIYHSQSTAFLYSLLCSGSGYFEHFHEYDLSYNAIVLWSICIVQFVLALTNIFASIQIFYLFITYLLTFTLFFCELLNTTDSNG